MKKTFKTNDYSMFDLYEFNREVRDEHNIRAIMEEMKKYGFDEWNPIIVSVSGKVADGQHRLEAAKRLGIDVWCDQYDREFGVEEIIRMNKNKKNWITSDYIHSRRGDEGACRMYDFILEGLKVGVTRSASTRLAMAANHKDQSTSKNGVDHFTLTQDEYDKAMLFLGELLTIKDYIPRGLSHAFIGAYMRAKACANFSYDVFIHKMKVDPKCFDRCRLMIDYVEKIEEVYNCRNNNKISINRDKIKTR